MPDLSKRASETILIWKSSITAIFDSTRFTILGLFEPARQFLVILSPLSLISKRDMPILIALSDLDFTNEPSINRSILLIR
jgi:hypothetical protein